ncbi:hypothetical protein ACLMJK_005891 [Lecanora helva]
MKISIAYAALLAIILARAATIANNEECFATDGPCDLLKRAAVAVAEADPGHRQCIGVGGVCWKVKRDICGASCLKAKRDALALAEAVAEAAPYAGGHHQCVGVGGVCWKAKRSVSAAAEALEEAESLAQPSPEDNTEAGDEEACNAAGGPCDVVKRTAKAAAEAMAEADPAHRQCIGVGGVCWKAKRTLEGLNNVVDSILG